MAAKTELTEQEIAKMPITKHLRELRDRIGKSVIVLIITVCVAFVFTPQLIEILKMPAGDVTLQAIELVEKLEVFVKVALAGGIILAMPFLVYQLLAYVSPALTRKEKTYIYGIIPFVTVMFLAGVAFAYFIALPPALYFLLGFMPDVAETVPRLSDYINVVTRIIVAVGCIFETPIIVMFLARMGIVTPQWLAKRRKLWVVLAFVVAAIVTPTFDPINQTIIALPLIILLELSILLARFVYKKRNEPSPEELEEEE